MMRYSWVRRVRWGHLLLWSIVAYGLLVNRVGVAAGVGGGKLRVLPSNQPVVHTHIGKLINSGAHFIIPLRLDLRSLVDTVRPLESALEATSAHYAALRDLMGGNSSRRGQTAPALAHFPGSLRDHISLLMSDLKERVASLKNMLWVMADINMEPPASLQRVNRGLFNAGGSALSYLFGVVDSSTFDEAESAITSLEDMSELEREQLNVHSRIINITQQHLQRIEVNQKKTLAALSEMDANVKLLSTALLKQTQEVFTISNTLALVSAISYVGTAISDLTHTFDKFSQGLEVMLKGTLSPELFSANELMAVINELDSKNIRSLWPGSPSYVGLFFKFCTVVSLNARQLTFLVLLPLLPEPNGELDLYRISSLPFPVNENVTLSYGELAPYLGVSKDHQLYLTLSEVDLASCRQFASIFYCDKPMPLYRNNRRASCEYALYVNRSIDISCVKHLSPHLPRPLLMKSENSWLYATSYGFDLTVVCPESTSTVKVQMGVGAIDLPPRCRASTDFAMIPTSKSIRRDETTVIDFTSVLPFRINFSQQEMGVVQKFTSDVLFQDLLNFNGRPVPMTALNNELGELRTIQFQRLRSSKTSAMAGWTSLGLIIFILVSCSVVAFCWYLMRRNQRLVEEERERGDRTPLNEARAGGQDFQLNTL